MILGVDSVILSVAKDRAPICKPALIAFLTQMLRFAQHDESGLFSHRV
jgi:hypothetical protein